MELSGIELNGLDWNEMEKNGMKKINDMSRVEKIREIRKLFACKVDRSHISELFDLPPKTLVIMRQPQNIMRSSEQLASSSIFPSGW
jgi:hypothetical protein